MVKEKVNEPLVYNPDIQIYSGDFSALNSPDPNTGLNPIDSIAFDKGCKDILVIHPVKDNTDTVSIRSLGSVEIQKIVKNIDDESTVTIHNMYVCVLPNKTLSKSVKYSETVAMVSIRNAISKYSKTSQFDAICVKDTKEIKGYKAINIAFSLYEKYNKIPILTELVKGVPIDFINVPEGDVKKKKKKKNKKK